MINLSLIEQENCLKQITRIFEHQASLIKIFPSSLNFSKCLFDTSELISLLKLEILTPSNYYLLFTDISELLQETIENYIRNKASKGIKIKYIYESVQQSQYLIPRVYLMIICGSIYIELNPIKYKEIIYELLNIVKCIQSPLKAFWVRYFLFKNLKDKLPIKIGEYQNNEEYAFEYKKISLFFLMKNLEEMIHYSMRCKKEIYIDRQKLDEKQRINMVSCLEEIIEEISNIKCLDKDAFSNKILPKLFEIIIEIDDENDFHLEQTIIMAVIKYFKLELYFEMQGISFILLILTKIIDNKSINIVTIFNNILNNYIKLIKKIKKSDEFSSLRNEYFSRLNETFLLFLSKYNELQILYKNSGEKEFNSFIDLDNYFMIFSYKILKQDNYGQLKGIVNSILDYCSKRLKMFTYGFKIETIKKICSLIEVTLKHKFTIIEYPIIENMIYYLDYNHRKHISLELIESFENISDEKDKINSLEKIGKLINLIIPLITESNEDLFGEDLDEYIEEENKNKYLNKLVYLLYSDKPEIMIQMLAKLKTFLNSGPIDTTQQTIPSIIYYIINYLKQIELFYRSSILNQNNNTKNSVQKFALPIEIEDNKEKIEKYFIKLIKDISELLKECILIIVNNKQSFKFFLMSSYQINNMNFIFELNKNSLYEIFEDFLQSSINILRNCKDKKIKIEMLHYLIGYLPDFKIFDKEKIRNILDSLIQEFSNIKNTKIEFNAAINICSLYFSILKDTENMEQLIDKSFQLVSKNLNSSENIYLLITLINKILYYIEKGYKPLSFDIINKSINLLKESKLLNEENNIEDLKEVKIYYKITLEFIKKKKNEKSNYIYDSLDL